jgi:hypothetical protein
VTANRGKVYRGLRLSGRGVLVQVEKPYERVLPLRHVVVHSPTGFEWGYGGSGPADLALSILADHFGEHQKARRRFSEEGVERAWRLHQHFKWDFVAKLPQEADEWAIGSMFIDAWVARRERGD